MVCLLPFLEVFRFGPVFGLCYNYNPPNNFFRNQQTLIAQKYLLLLLEVSTGTFTKTTLTVKRRLDKTKVSKSKQPRVSSNLFQSDETIFNIIISKKIL